MTEQSDENFTPGSGPGETGEQAGTAAGPPAAELIPELEIMEPATEPEPPPAAGGTRRFLAFAVDGLILSIILDIAWYVFTLGAGYEPVVGQGKLLLFDLVLFVAYFSMMESGGRRSWGKGLLGLAVTDRDGSPAGRLRCLVRSLVAAATVGAGFLWVVFNRDRRAFHDIVTGTKVVRIQGAGRDFLRPYQPLELPNWNRPAS